MLRAGVYSSQAGGQQQWWCRREQHPDRCRHQPDIQVGGDRHCEGWQVLYSQADWHWQEDRHLHSRCKLCPSPQHQSKVSNSGSGHSLAHSSPHACTLHLPTKQNSCLICCCWEWHALLESTEMALVYREYSHKQHMFMGMYGSSMSEVTSLTFSIPYSCPYDVCRSVEDSQDPMAQLEFRLPADALVPLPGSVAPPRPRPTAPPVSSDPFDAFGSTPATAAATRDDFADLESLGAIGAPKAQAVAGTHEALLLASPFLFTLLLHLWLLALVTCLHCPPCLDAGSKRYLRTCLPSCLFTCAAASDPFSNMFGSMDMTAAVQQGGTTGPTPLDLNLLLAGGPSGPTSGPSMGFTTPSQAQVSPQGTLVP